MDTWYTRWCCTRRPPSKLNVQDGSPPPSICVLWFSLRIIMQWIYAKTEIPQVMFRNMSLGQKKIGSWSLSPKFKLTCRTGKYSIYCNRWLQYTLRHSSLLNRATDVPVLQIVVVSRISLWRPLMITVSRTPLPSTTSTASDHTIRR